MAQQVADEREGLEALTTALMRALDDRNNPTVLFDTAAFVWIRKQSKVKYNDVERDISKQWKKKGYTYLGRGKGIRPL